MTDGSSETLVDHYCPLYRVVLPNLHSSATLILVFDFGKRQRGEATSGTAKGPIALYLKGRLIRNRRT